MNIEFDSLFRIASQLKPGADLQFDQPVLERYRVTRLLGVGGTAIVVCARDEMLGRDVALKIWNAALAARRDWGKHARTYFKNEADVFRSEARKLASIRHPSLCAVYDFGISPDGIPWMSLEYIPGDTLRATLGTWRLASTPVALDFVLDIFRQIVEAVAFLHSSGRYQLDLKPENIILNNDHVHLIDFATSLERPGHDYEIKGARHGTPGYVAPEIIVRTEASATPELTPAVDVFSLGVILLEMLTLDNPLATRDLQEAAYDALGIVERAVYCDYSTAAFFPDFSGRLAKYSADYLKGIRTIVIPDHVKFGTPPDGSALQPAVSSLLADCLREEPGGRPSDGGSLLSRLASIDRTTKTLGPVFVSHSHHDKEEFVAVFVEALVARGVSVWYDMHDIKVGEPFWDRIFRALQTARFVVAVVSKHLLESRGALEELRFAHLENLDQVKILPILIDHTPVDALPPMLRSRQVMRFPGVEDPRFFSTVDEFVRQMRSLGASEANN